MIIDKETFIDAAVHLKLASDALLKTARHLSALADLSMQDERNWQGALDGLTAINQQIANLEGLLRGLREANKEEGLYS